MTIELIFHGELRPGIERQDALAALAARFKQSPEALERRLFGGGAVRVKTVASEAEAQRWVQAFQQAGAVLHVQRQEAEPPSEAPPEAPTGSAGQPSAGHRRPPHATPPRVRKVQPRRRRRSRLPLIGVAAACGIAVLAAAGAWYTQPLWRPGDTSDQQRAAALALATDDLVALAHLDVARTAALETRLRGDSDPDALLSPGNEFLATLRQVGIHPAEHIDDILVAAYSDGNRASFAGVVLGDLDPDRVQRWLDTNYQVERADSTTGTTYFTWMNEQTCRPSALHAVRMGGGVLAVAEADRIDALWPRLAGGADSAADIDQWLALTEHQMATLGIFAPASMGQAAGGLTGMMLRGAGQAAEPASAVYLGAAPTLLPPGVELAASIESDDADFLRNAHRAAETWLAEAKAAAEPGFPELLDIYQRISFTATDRTVSAAARLDTEFDDEIRTLITGILGRAFRITPSPAGGNQAVTERVEENPVTFANASAADIKPFDAYGDAFFEPQWRGGPFALAISSLTLKEDGLVTIGLQGEGRGLPNLGARSELARLRILDIVDSAGRSLLPPRQCGPGPERQWTDFGGLSEGMRFENGRNVSFPKVALQKTLRLAPGAAAADVAAIRGEIEFDLPGRIRTTRVEQPLAGKVVETPDVRVRFQNGPPHSLDYQVSGDTGRLVAVRGLNAAGQVLSTGSAMWGDDLFGGGKRASVDLNGTAAAAEVVLAEALEPLRYSFTLPTAYPTIQERERHFPDPPDPATPGQLADAMGLAPPAVTFSYAKPVQTAAAGPVLVALQRIQTSAFMGLVAQLDVYAPAKLPLEGQLNGATIALDQAELADGTRVPLALSAPVTFGRDGGYWMDGEYQTDPERPWLKGQAGLQAAGFEGGQPVALTGRLIVRANRGVRTASLGAEPGAHFEDEDVALAVREWRENALTIGISRGADRIVAMTAVADGRTVGRAGQIDPGQDVRRSRIDLSGVPDAIEVTLATGTETQERPFRLAPGE